jgi:hypothetical protein
VFQGGFSKLGVMKETLRRLLSDFLRDTEPKEATMVFIAHCISEQSAIWAGRGLKSLAAPQSDAKE